MSFSFWQKLCLEQPKEPRGQMCKEHVRPPKNYVFDGPKCDVAESTCIKMALFSFWLLDFLSGYFQGFIGQLVLRRNISREHPSRECGNIPKQGKMKASCL